MKLALFALLCIMSMVAMVSADITSCATVRFSSDCNSCCTAIGYKSGQHYNSRCNCFGPIPGRFKGKDAPRPQYLGDYIDQQTG